jgi:hypothetical protein
MSILWDIFDLVKHFIEGIRMFRRGVSFVEASQGTACDVDNHQCICGTPGDHFYGCTVVGKTCQCRMCR